MKYYIILVSILSTLIFSGSLVALSSVVNSQQDQVQYIIQRRINAVKEALR